MLTTDTNGEIRLHEQGKRLYPGEYTITEVEPAPGFQMAEPTTQKIILHGGETKTVTFQNAPLNAIIVEKYDSVTGEALPGCTFQLRYLGGTSGTGGTIIGQKVTGKNGTAIWTSLKPGTYILEEVDPANGYSIIQSSETVYLADSGEQSVITVRFKNMPDGNLLIRKVCSVNPSITLPDAEFKIMYADGTVIGDSNGIFRTDENGEIRIEGLKPGKSVVVTEVTAPPGYIIDTQSQTIQIKEGRTVSLTFKNQPKGELIIQKRDSATGKPLPGAEFRVTTAAGCEVGVDGVIGTSTLTQNGIFTTDSNGEIRISNLAPGAYVITEIKAPQGYVMDQPSTNVVIGEGGDTQTVVIKNSKAGSLVINKLDSLTGEPLEGVTFKVTTSTGEFVPDENGYISSNGLYKTDKDGKIQIDGVVGTLVVTETQTIPGYTIDPGSQTQTVVVNPNDTQTLTFYNTPSTTLVIEKYIEGTTTPLKGVTFLVTDSSGEVVGPSNGEYITDENGRIVIDGLEPGTTVTAREVKTLEGYVLDGAPKSIKIKAGEVQTLRFYNQQAGTSITIHGSEWYDHEEHEGGNAISFVRRHYGFSYPEAVEELLGRKSGVVYPAAQKLETSPKPFELPEVNQNSISPTQFTCHIQLGWGRFQPGFHACSEVPVISGRTDNQSTAVLYIGFINGVNRERFSLYTADRGNSLNDIFCHLSGISCFTVIYNRQFHSIPPITIHLWVKAR